MAKLKVGKTLDRVGDGALGFAAAGFASLAFLLVWGRVINSPTVLRLEQTLPFLAMVTRPMRAATNQAYDPAGEA